MPQITNPILPGFNPDPSICRVGDDYYIATSTFEWFPGVQIHHSRDLANWDLVTRPLTRKAQLKVSQTSDFALRAQGLLSLGSPESAEESADLFRVVDKKNILFGSELLGAVKALDPETGHSFDDTKRYIDALNLSLEDRHAIFEGNVRRVYPLLDKRLKAQNR